MWIFFWIFTRGACSCIHEKDNNLSGFLHGGAVVFMQEDLAMICLDLYMALQLYLRKTIICLDLYTTVQLYSWEDLAIICLQIFCSAVQTVSRCLLFSWQDLPWQLATFKPFQILFAQFFNMACLTNVHSFQILFAQFFNMACHSSFQPLNLHNSLTYFRAWLWPREQLQLKISKGRKCDWS